jgi:hypothetical protein
MMVWYQIDLWMDAVSRPLACSDAKLWPELLKISAAAFALSVVGSTIMFNSLLSIPSALVDDAKIHREMRCYRFLPSLNAVAVMAVPFCIATSMLASSFWLSAFVLPALMLGLGGFTAILDLRLLADFRRRLLWSVICSVVVGLFVVAMRVHQGISPTFEAAGIGVSVVLVAVGVAVSFAAVHMSDATQISLLVAKKVKDWHDVERFRIKSKWREVEAMYDAYHRKYPRRTATDAVLLSILADTSLAVDRVKKFQITGGPGIALYGLRDYYKHMILARENTGKLLIMFEAGQTGDIRFVSDRDTPDPDDESDPDAE